MRALGRFVLRTAAAVLLGLTTVSSCKIKRVDTELEPPPRPKSVPDGAIWAGGVDGGSFIILKARSPAGEYSARIYDDTTGDVIFDGALTLVGDTSAPVDAADPKTFGFWDGSRLHLRDGRWLHAHSD